MRWPAGQLFSSLPCSVRFLYPSPYGGGAGYRLSWVRRVYSARPQAAHVGPAGPLWNFVGVVPTRFTKSHTGLTRAFPVSFILPLWGKAGLTSQLVPANLHEFAHNRLTQRQQGLFGASLVLLPSSFPKTAHRATQSRVWFHRFFLMRFGSGKATKSRSSLYSIASWMGRIV